MNDKYYPIVVEISKLELTENQYLVMKFEDDIPLTTVELVMHTLRERLPEISKRILIIHGNIELYVVEKK